MKLRFITIFLLLTITLLLFCSCDESTSSSTNSNYSTSSNDTISKAPTSQEKDVSETDNGKYADSGELKIRIFKMGKSDAYLFRTSSKTILIDCGDVDNSQEILDYFTEKTLSKIDYLILTHLDKKSIGGAAAIINGLEIGTVYEPNYVKNNTEYIDYSTALSDKNISSVKIDKLISFEADDVKFEITPCEKSYYSDDDNYSSAISVTHGENKFLFVGDAKSDRIKEIIAKENIKHDFLMMPDNGALDPETENLINAVSPTYAAITCSTKNPASNDVLSKLSSKGINTYLTVNGSIKITSDGSKILLEQ
ncbi:MAG: MBL fold metallo-hydrolase [Ruminococcaceae bacterium]|nr:MBL fold metallo-hydrolase [Oscillospiraceae bacterium]